MTVLRLSTVFTRPPEPSSVPKSSKQWDAQIKVEKGAHDSCEIEVVHGYGLVVGEAQDRVRGWTVPETTAPQLINTSRLVRNAWSQYLQTGQGIEALAQRGNDLFTLLFRTNAEGEPADADRFREGLLNHLKKWLAARAAEPGGEMQPALQVQIISRSLHLPWNLLYPFDGFDDINPEAFFGFVFCFEEDPRVGQSPSGEWGGKPPTHFSLQLDQGIDPTWGVHQQVEDVLKLFEDNEIDPIPRYQSEDLRQALSTSTIRDEIIYFCCHGYGIGNGLQVPHIRLTDRARQITPLNIESWMGKKKFAGEPVVFLNTCHGGDLNEEFYPQFVAAFIKRRAIAVVGPLIEVPTAVAGWFAGQFFEAIFAGQPAAQRRSVGDILYHLRAARWHSAKDLSGLLYMVYSVVPVFFHRQLVRRRKSPPKDPVQVPESRQG